MTDTESFIGSYYAFVEELMCGPPGRAAGFLATDFVEHAATGDRSRDEFLAVLAARRERLPDGVWTIEVLAGWGALVVCHTTIASVDADGKPVRVQETAIMRFVSGKIAECWRTSGDEPGRSLTTS